MRHVNNVFFVKLALIRHFSQISSEFAQQEQENLDSIVGTRGYFDSVWEELNPRRTYRFSTYRGGGLVRVGAILLAVWPLMELELRGKKRGCRALRDAAIDFFKVSQYLRSQVNW